MAEERVRAGDVATFERGADRSRRDRRAAGGDRGNDDAGPPFLAAERLQEGRRALAAPAEVEIVTDDDAGCAELLPEQALDESGGRRACKAGVDAVEIADRQDRAAQGRRHGVPVAADGESARRLFGRRS